MEGVLTDAPRGTRGFGYDPIFLDARARSDLRRAPGRGEGPAEPPRPRRRRGAPDPRPWARAAAAARLPRGSAARTERPAPRSASGGSSTRSPRTRGASSVCPLTPVSCEQPVVEDTRTPSPARTSRTIARRSRVPYSAAERGRASAACSTMLPNWTSAVGPEVAGPPRLGDMPVERAQEARQTSRGHRSAGARPPADALADHARQQRHEREGHRQAIPEERPVVRVPVVVAGAGGRQGHAGEEGPVGRRLRRVEGGSPAGPAAVAGEESGNPRRPTTRKGRLETTFRKFGTPKSGTRVGEGMVRGILRDRGHEGRTIAMAPATATSSAIRRRRWISGRACRHDRVAARHRGLDGTDFFPTETSGCGRRTAGTRNAREAPDGRERRPIRPRAAASLRPVPTLEASAGPTLRADPRGRGRARARRTTSRS